MDVIWKAWMEKKKLLRIDFKNVHNSQKKGWIYFDFRYIFLYHIWYICICVRYILFTVLHSMNMTHNLRNHFYSFFSILAVHNNLVASIKLWIKFLLKLNDYTLVWQILIGRNKAHMHTHIQMMPTKQFQLNMWVCECVGNILSP